MPTYPGGTTTVTLTETVSGPVADAAGLEAGDRASGTVLKLRHEDAQELVAAGVASFGSPTDGGNTVGTRFERPTRVVSGTTATLQARDIRSMVEATSGSATTITVPTQATVPIPAGSVIRIRQYGAGQVTVAPAAGVTVRARVGLKTAGQYAEVRLTKRTDNEWVLTGEAAA